jgi:hypothetical protein
VASYSDISSTIAAILFSCALAQAQPQALRSAGGISMGSVEALNQRGTGPVLIGGEEARTSDWPASFYSIASHCTATLVGPRALLLAAHCVGNNQEAAIRFRDQTLSGPCMHAAEYRDGDGDRSADYALCKLRDAADGIQFETLNRDPQKIALDKLLLLTGYGCTAPPPPGGGPPTGGNDGKYRIGKAKIVALPGTLVGEPNTILTRDKITVCPGDSGGGAYIVLTAQRRLLVSVNSRVWFPTGDSYLSSVSSPVGLAFLSSWAASNSDEKICGFNFSHACR